jgi:transcriptional regulator with XRE-family HTH domain
MVAAPHARDQKRVPGLERTCLGTNVPPQRRERGAILKGMDEGARRPNQLGDFLKARRAQLTPSDVGLALGHGHRRVPGLRREEVAQLASISVDYLSRLERGRVPASATVLMTLARALGLDDDQRAYMYALAGKAPAIRRRRAPQRVRPAMRRLLDQLTETPALVIGKRLDVLAWNEAATALYTDFAAYEPPRRNYVYLLFNDPSVRGLHPEWAQAASTSVATLRMEAADDPDDPVLAALVGELSVQHEEFRTWWAAHKVTTTTSGRKHYRHSIVGDLTLDCDMWDSPEGGGQRLMVLTAEPGTPSHDRLRILTPWTTTPHSSRSEPRIAPRTP